MALWIFLLGVLLAFQGGSGCRPGQEKDLPELQTYDLGGDFTLTSQDGKAVGLPDFRGRVVLLFFGYTFCPDFCPTTLSRLVRVGELLDARPEEVHTLFITVDPQRDSPEQLRAYLNYFDFPLTGLTGREAEIRRVVSMYGATYRKGESGADGHYLVDHSTRIYLIDQQGRVRYLIGHTDPPELIAALVARLLRAGSG